MHASASTHQSRQTLFVLAICLTKDVHGSTGCINTFCAGMSNELTSSPDPVMALLKLCGPCAALFKGGVPEL